MREIWSTDLFTNPKTQTAIFATEMDNTVFSIWEENYQDLSGWCMDPFQGRCAFPIGEFEESRHSGTKREDHGVSVKKVEMIAKESSDLLESNTSPVRSSCKVEEFIENPETNKNSTPDVSLPAIKAEIVDTQAIDINDVLLNPTESSILGVEPVDWIQLANVKGTNDSMMLDIQQVLVTGNKNNNIINAECNNTIPFDNMKYEKDNWDVINTFDNTGSGAFDLLSYLCDDNIQSPESSVSRDSRPTLESNSSVSSPLEIIPKSRELRNTRRAENVMSKSEEVEASTSTAASIAAISAALESVSNMSRRTSSRVQKRASKRTRNESECSSSQGEEKKRCIDSDSEDRVSDCSSYRESREKNNEASRKSRMNKKAKETEMMAKAGELERDNRILKMKVEELEKLVTSMRSTILRSALKKRF